MALRLADFNPPDEDTDAGPAIQRMIDYGYARGISSFDFQSREYLINTTVNLPNPQSAADASEKRRAVYNGNGASFKVGSGVTAFRRTYSDANTHVSNSAARWWSPAFRDMSFRNAGDGTGRAINIWGASSCIFEGLEASGLGKSTPVTPAFQVLFGLYAHYKNCVTTDCGIGYRALGGQGVSGANLTNGTQSNHNSNLIRYESCRAQMSATDQIGFYVETATNYTLQSCITEGSDCNTCVYINSNTFDGHKEAVNGRIIDHWVEMNTSCGTVFKVDIEKAICVIDNVRWGANVGTAVTGRLIDALASNRSVFVVRNTPFQEIEADGMTEWFDQGATAGSFDNQWYFADNILQTGNTLTDSDKWESGSGAPINITESRTFPYDL